MWICSITLFARVSVAVAKVAASATWTAADSSWWMSSHDAKMLRWSWYRSKANATFSSVASVAFEYFWFWRVKRLSLIHI